MDETRKNVLELFMRLQAMLQRSQTQNFMNFGPWGNPQRGQGRVLSILKIKPEISQKELSYLLDMSKQSLAELLSKLERNGFITREASEEDRRSVNIKLTGEGAKVAGHMDDSRPELEKLFDCLNDDEVAIFSEYLRRITERFEEQYTGDGDDMCKHMMERFMGNSSQSTKEQGNSFADCDCSEFFGNRFGKNNPFSNM